MVEFTGERIIPGQVDIDLLNEHFARYAFAARLSRGKRVLDAGCGTGYGSVELAKAALSVTGLDLAADAVGFAREHYRLPNLCFEQGSVLALPHADSSFELVVSFEVIEHLEDWRTFLSEVRRVLSPGGQFVVSTPNRLYYAESRERIGPNPFHVHEFDYREFHEELAAVFPHISLFVENHVEGVVFQPVERWETAEVRVDAAAASTADAHFFLAVCAHRLQTGNPTFVYVPQGGNVLREREQHIALLEGEIRQKNEWLEKAQRELLDLNAEFRGLQAELEERNEWALELNRRLDVAAARIRDLEQEVADMPNVVAAYEAQVAGLEQENRAKTEWAVETERRLGGELQQKLQELAGCVEYLHTAEKTVEERTAWARSLEEDVGRLQSQVALYQGSRWVKLGRRFGLGPEPSRA